MSEDYLEDINKSYVMEKNMFVVIGLYPQETYACIYTLRTVFLWIFTVGNFIPLWVNLAIGINSFWEATDILYFLLTQTAYVCKVINFMILRRNMLKIEEHLRQPIFYKYLKKYGAEYLKHSVWVCTNGAILFRITVVVLTLFYGIYPYLDKNPDKILPFNGWYPVDKHEYRWILYIKQMICLSASALVNSSFDIFTMFMINIGISLLKMLKRCLNEIDYSDKNSDGIVSKDLGYLVELHQHVLTYIFKIEKLFSYGIFLQFLCSVGVICLGGFQLLMVTVRSAEFFMLISYLVCIICQIALYCWFGNEILVEGESIGDACYMSNWYEGTTKTKKVLFLIMEYSKKGVKLTAGKFFTLSLTTFLLVLKSSYSYFAVLRQVYADN